MTGCPAGIKSYNHLTGVTDRGLLIGHLAEIWPKDVSGGQQWQYDAEWWGHETLSRLRYRVALEDGRRLTVFRNMDHGGWYYLAGAAIRTLVN